jgi:putative hydrolase of the HAD superfamily
MLKAIFFDAAETLFHLPKGVGYHYALVGQGLDMKLNADELDRAFASAWKQMPARSATGLPREDDDKGWWRELVDRILDQVSPSLQEPDRDTFFEVAYQHFAEAGVWELYPEVIEVLESLCGRFELSVISNFDGRLRMILEQLGVSKFFRYVFISSELGADKPDPAIYRQALEVISFAPNEILHVGDDPERDWNAAAKAGLQVFKLDRKKNSLRDLLTIV